MDLYYRKPKTWFRWLCQDRDNIVYNGSLFNFLWRIPWVFSSWQILSKNLIEKCAKDINSRFHITRTPGPSPWAEMSFTHLLKKEISMHVSTTIQTKNLYSTNNIYLSWYKMESGSLDKNVKVKLSGDGAKISHTSSLFVFSFSLPEMEGQNVLSSVGKDTKHGLIVPRY